MLPRGGGYTNCFSGVDFPAEYVNPELYGPAATPDCVNSELFGPAATPECVNSCLFGPAATPECVNS